jgi:hypothetical protein
MPTYVVVKEFTDKLSLNADRADVIKRLYDLGYVRIHRNVLINQRKDKADESSFFKNLPIIFLRISREIHKPWINEETNTFDLGSLILVAYRLPRDERIQKATNRIFRRAPCFKLARSVYIFSQIRYNKYEDSVLQSPSTILRRMIMFGIQTIYIPKVTISNASLTKSLISELEENLSKRVQKILDDCTKLQQLPKSQVNKKISELKIEIRVIRHLLLFYEKELKITHKDVNSSLRKSLRRLSEVKK